MPLECPKCGSRYLRESQPRTVAERAGKLKFLAPLRCMDCKTRFVARTLVFRDMFFAKCPDCLRMDLNSWSGKTYDPPLMMRIKISLGAQRWRCEYCRKNFVDFRPRKEIFSFKRWEKRGAGLIVAEGRAKFAVDEFKAMAQAEIAEQEQLKAARENALALAAEEAEAKAAEEAEERERREEQERRAKKKKKVSRLVGELEAPVSRRDSMTDREAALAYTNSLVRSAQQAVPPGPAVAADTDSSAGSEPSSKIKKYSGAPELVYPKPRPAPTGKPDEPDHQEVDTDSYQP